MGEVSTDARIRTVCQRLAKEQDPGKIEKLAGELRRAVDTEQDEARIRLRYIAQRYHERLRGLAGHTSAGHISAGHTLEDRQTKSEQGLQLRAVIAFLGIGVKVNGGGQPQQ
jgi:hypothetical protein